jgi:hypothetical protein
MSDITLEQLVNVMAVLQPQHAGKLQEAFGVKGSGKAYERKGFVHISKSDREWQHPEVIELAEAVCPKWSEDGFSAKKWIRAARESVRKLREAIPESALAFLLRKGVQTLANDWYVASPRDWQDYALAASSNAVAEWYAPLYGSTIAGQVGRGERFPEGQVIGEDSVLVNNKYGLIESFDRELFDDDQTGQIRQRAQRLGQSMAVTESAYAALRFIGSAATYANLSVKASGYTTTDVNGNPVIGPWSSTLNGASGNRPTAYVALGLTPLKQAHSDLLNMKDPLSNKIIVNPNVLVHSSMDDLHAKMLVKPPAGVPYYPATPGLATQTASTATSGSAGGAYFGANPFMGLGWNPVLARYLPDWAWALGEKGKGFIFQERDPLEIIQENPASGQAFDGDAIRFRSRRRFEADWIGGGSRFFWLGNDGTTTGSF